MKVQPSQFAIQLEEVKDNVASDSYVEALWSRQVSRNESEQISLVTPLQLVRLSDLVKPAIAWEEMAIYTMWDCRGYN